MAEFVTVVLIRNAHAYLSAPYGVYATADGWLAIAMTPLPKLALLMDLPDLARFDGTAAFRNRDAAKEMIAARLAARETADWLAVFEPADLWCAQVLDWPRLLPSGAVDLLEMFQSVTDATGTIVRTTRLPMRIDGIRPQDGRAAPRIGQHTADILASLG